MHLLVVLRSVIVSVQSRSCSKKITDLKLISKYIALLITYLIFDIISLFIIYFWNRALLLYLLLILELFHGIKI